VSAATIGVGLACAAFSLVAPAHATPAKHRADDSNGGSASTSSPASPPARRTDASSDADVPAVDLNRVAIQMWQMVNQDRSSSDALSETKGCARPLQWDSRLAEVARSHSEEMATTGVFSHRGGDGSLPMNRVTRAGIRWLATGENIAKAESAAQAEALFMDEPRFQPNHRGNILDANYNRVGIGIARGADGSLYITQEFAEIP
jgi:uncharacterized protein YkwD